MVWRVCEYPDRHDYDTVDASPRVAFGGSPSADELQRMVRETFPNVTQHQQRLRPDRVQLGGDRDQRARTPWTSPTSVGPPVPVVEIAHRRRRPAPRCPQGDTGEVLIKGPIIMPGYWGKPEATAETVIDGWLHTGDIGHLDEDGYLYITDRAKDMIIRGGENIYCVEIEQRLVEHPDDRRRRRHRRAPPRARRGGQGRGAAGRRVATLTEARRPGVGGRDAGQLQGAGLRRAHRRQAPPQRSGKLLKNVLRGEGEVSFAETM